MPKLYFSREFKEIEVAEGQDLRTIAAEHKIPIYAGLAQFLNCRGRGLCGTCKVRVKPQQVLSERTKAEIAKLPQTDPTIRLGCQTYVYGNCEVQTYPRPRQGWMEHKCYQHLIEE
jgi:ferredoxin